MIGVFVSWWLWLHSQPAADERTDAVTATVEARGASPDFARVESEYRCRKRLQEQCEARKLQRPDNVNLPWPQCIEGLDGVTTCTSTCAGECAEPADDAE